MSQAQTNAFISCRRASRSRPLHALRAALAWSPALLLAACGGGGGDGGAAPPPGPGGVTAVAITEANAKPVAADALASAININTSQSALLSGVQVQSGGSSGGALVLAQVVRDIAVGQPASAPQAMGVQAQGTYACELGGTITVDGNIATSAGPTAGDSFTITARACKETIRGVVTTLNGTLSVNVTSGSATTVPFHVVMTLVARDLSTETASERTTSDGDMVMDWTANSDTDQTMILSGSALRAGVTRGGVSHTATWRDYRQELHLGGATATSAVAATIESVIGRVSASPVSYHVTTPAAITLDTNAHAITAGSIHVTGAANSQLLLTSTGPDAFRLQVDASGDGTYEATQTTTRSELESLL